MRFHELAPGKRSPIGSDYVTLDLQPDGRAGFTFTRRSGVVDTHSVSPQIFETEYEALKAAIDWAEQNGVEVLYVERPGS